MDKFDKEFLKKLKEKRKNYQSMIDYCCDSLILNNDIQARLEEEGFDFDIYCGSLLTYYNEKGEEITEEQAAEIDDPVEELEEERKEIYQSFIISEQDAERLAKWTDEIVTYCEELDLYLLNVTHFGTLWEGVPANWKNADSEGEQEEKGGQNENNNKRIITRQRRR